MYGRADGARLSSAARPGTSRPSWPTSGGTGAGGRSPFSLQILSGIESAWGRARQGPRRAGVDFLGGRVHHEVDFMAFPQGDTAEELAGEAARSRRGLSRRLHQGRPWGPRRRGDRRRGARRDRPGAAASASTRTKCGTSRARRRDPAAELFELDWVEQPVAGPARRGSRHSPALRRDEDRRRPGRAHDRPARAVLDQEARTPIVLGSHGASGLWRWRQHGVPRRIVRDPDEPACVPGERDLDLRRAAGDGDTYRTRPTATR